VIYAAVALAVFGYIVAVGFTRNPSL